jgi:polysaccharide biosynthesis/export protein
LGFFGLSRAAIVCVFSGEKPVFRAKFILSIVSVTALVAGCALPASAPTSLELERVRTEQTDANFLIVNVNSSIARVMSQRSGHQWPTSFAAGTYVPSVALRAGDVIAISIYETGGSFLFGGGTPGDATQAQGRTTTLPTQVIEPSGNISVPFVGRISLAGSTPERAARKIEQQLGQKTVQPQVVVSLVSSTTTAASIGGEANRPGIVALTLRGERLLDAIAIGGGPKYPSTEIDVRMQRRGVNYTVPLQAIIANPALNVAVRPNDELYLIRNPKTFTVMGASQKVSQYTFDTVKVTLAEALARAGGIIDTVGNPDGIYLLRSDYAHLLDDIIAASPNSVVDPRTQRPVLKRHHDEHVNLVFRIDLRSAGGYFAAGAIAMRDKDIVLVSNAETTQLLKLMTVARAFTGAATDLRKTSN